MKSFVRPMLLGLAATLLAAPAQAQSVAGQWLTEFDRMIRNENGAVSGGEKVRARMTLEQKGDSVVGTLQIVSPGAGPAPTPRKLRGTVADGKVTLVSDPMEARVNRNGEESVVRMTSIYEFAVAGDALNGTVKVSSESGMDMPSRPFSAWREKP